MRKNVNTITSQKLEMRGSNNRLGNPELRVPHLSQNLPARGRYAKTPGAGGGVFFYSRKSLPYKLETQTRSTIELAHFRYFVSERRSSLIPNRRNVNLDLE